MGKLPLYRYFLWLLVSAQALLSTTAYADAESPSVLISQPSSGVYISRNVDIVVDATDNAAIANVTVTVGGVAIKTLYTHPYKITWDSAAVAQGQYSLTAIAMDTSGNQASSTITINVDNGSASYNPPYPYSESVSGIVWANPSTVRRAANQSDEWPATWADDDAMYTAYGDGWGFEPKVERKLSIGYAKIAGSPADFVGENIRSPSGERLAGNGRSQIKPSGMLMVAGRLYMWLRNADRNGREAQLAWSDDYGTTWTFSSWRFAELGYAVFLNYGKNYAGARDDYVYTYSPNTPDAYRETDSVVLARVPNDQILQRNAYEFVSGFDTDGNPTWSSDINQREPVFIFPGGSNRLSVTYDAGIGRYLMVMRSRGENGGLSQFSIYDAPDPWGPWSTVYYTENYFGESLGGIHDGWDVSGNFPSKWMSADGKDIHLIYSSYDNFAVHRVTLTAARPTANGPPNVDAGSDEVLVLPDYVVSLAGTVTDDGLPSNSVDVIWSVNSGPGNVSFADEMSVDTTAEFSVAGTYQLRLTADDGDLTASDDVAVEVFGAAVLTTIAVTPDSVTIQPGGMRQFSATGYDQRSEVIPISPMWGAGGGTIDQSGFFTSGVVEGQYTVTATDAGVSGNAAINISSAQPEERYLEFDNSRVEISDSASLDMTDGITVEAWIKPESLPDSGNRQARVVSKTKDYELTVYSGDSNCAGAGGDVQWRAVIGGNDRRICGGTLTLGQWNHVAGTFDGGEFILYVDGIRAASEFRNGSIQINDSEIVVGNYPTLSRPFRGGIDEVRIWNRARSEQDIIAGMDTELSGSEIGLAAYYQFDEGSGQAVMDLSLNGNNGILGTDPGADALDPTWIVSGQ